MWVAGVDLGSNTIKALILDKKHRIVSFRIALTGALGMLQSKNILIQALEGAFLTWNDLSYIASTGYGRERADYAGLTTSEITCHAKGAHSLFPQVRTVIDIGGQDAKVIKLDGKGNVKNFAMNDKCAAGTGRFLEVMARALELDIREMGNRSLNSKTELSVSSQCTVFAESEVISLLAQGHNIDDIIAGVHRAMASRVAQLVRRIRAETPMVLEGGVAKNIGFVRALESLLGCPLLIPPEDPQIIGALGAALIALNRVLSQTENY